MSIIIEDPKRSGVVPLIALYGLTNTGKTWGALTLARGLAGPDGLIVIAEAENNRASFYTGMFGGFKLARIKEPYSSLAFVEAIVAIENAGAKCGIIDGLSPEWNGPGGVLDQASESEQRTGKSGLHNWKKPKLLHQQLINRILASPIPWIVCLRAKYLTRQGKENGKTVIIKDDEPSAIQDDEFLFEATCVALMHPGNRVELKKWTHPDLKKCFPDNAPLEIHHGRMIAEWCTAGSAPQKLDRKALVKKLWAITKPIHQEDKAKLEAYLKENGFMKDSLTLEALTESELENLIQIAENFV